MKWLWKIRLPEVSEMTGQLTLSFSIHTHTQTQRTFCLQQIENPKLPDLYVTVALQGLDPNEFTARTFKYITGIVVMSMVAVRLNVGGSRLGLLKLDVASHCTTYDSLCE